MTAKEFAYAREKSFFNIGALPQNKLEFTVVLEDVTSRTYGSQRVDSILYAGCSICFVYLIDNNLRKSWRY